MQLSRDLQVDETMHPLWKKANTSIPIFFIIINVKMCDIYWVVSIRFARMCDFLCGEYKVVLILFNFKNSRMDVTNLFVLKCEL